MKVFILFSDGTWVSCNEIVKEEIIVNHWAFSLDIKENPQRKATIIETKYVKEEYYDI